MHALPHSKPSVFLMCCVRVSGSLLQSDGTVVLTHALTSRGRRAECVHLCVCVRVSLGRGHKGTLDIHSYTYAQAHTQTLALLKLFLAPGKWKVPHNVGSLTLVTEEHFEDRFQIPPLFLPCNSYFCSFFSLDFHNPSMTPAVFFSSPSFFMPFFFCSHNIVQETHLKRSVFTKKDSGHNFIEQRS